MEENQHWHLDKRVPIVLILALSLQTAGVIWWAATMTERVTNMEEVMAVFMLRLEAVEGQADNSARVEAVIAEQIRQMRLDIQDNNNLLRELVNQGRQP